MSKGILCDGTYYCDHIGTSVKDEEDIMQFRVKHREFAVGLGNYIKYCSFSDETKRVMRTYIVRDYVTDDVVGYFSLKAGLISLNERVVFDDSENNKIVFDTMPGIEIANYALNANYRNKHPESKGIGVAIFRHFIMELSYQAAEIIGARLLYIFSLPIENLVKRYNTVYHFTRLDDSQEDALHKRIKPIYDKSCIFMYQLL